MTHPGLRRVAHIVLYASALLSLGLLGWATWYNLSQPDVGMSWSFADGLVDQVDDEGPASGKVMIGDWVLAVDGIPVQSARLIPGRHAGDAIHFAIRHADERREIVVAPVPPAPGMLLSRFATMVVAFVFWAIGTAVLAFERIEKSGLLFFLYFAVTAVTLAMGAVSATGPVWTVYGFSILTWWVGVLAVHFHLHFPVPMLPCGRLGLIGLYGLAGLGTLLSIATDSVVLEGPSLALYVARRLWVGISLALVVVLLWHTYRRPELVEARRQIQAIVFSSGAAFLAFMSFSVLPNTMFHQPVVSYDLSAVFLMVIPLGYGYAVLRFRLIKLDHYINRSAALALTLVLFCGLCMVVYALSMRVLGGWRGPVSGVAGSLVCALIAVPLFRYLRRGVDHIVYGHWYDYRSAIQQISGPTEPGIDSAGLARLFVHRLRQVMRFDCVGLLVWQADRGGADVFCEGESSANPLELSLNLDGPLGQFLRTLPGIAEHKDVYEAVIRGDVSNDEARLLSFRTVKLWIAISGRDRPAGVLFVGLRPGEEIVNALDRALLEAAARHISVMLQNAQLADKLRERIAERVQLNQQALRMREEERKRVARELHDEIVQALVGLNYHLSEMRNDTGANADGRIRQLQDEVRCVMHDVRRICSDLRPPALDNLGLIAAVGARAHELEEQTGLEVRFKVEGDADHDLPEAVALCAFRTFQEALQNIQKHAAATQVEMRLTILPSEVRLLVRDNGRGFGVPRHLGKLITEGHFGLIGLRERLEAVGGTLEVRSQPGGGTWIEAQIPLEA